MTSMTLIWTTLPAGIRRIDGDWQARLSVFLTPRLEATEGEPLTLSAFPEFVDWPATLQAAAPDGIGFEVNVCDGKKVVARTLVHPLVGGDRRFMPDSAAWQWVFSASTLVRPVDPPKMMLAATADRSYPAGEFDRQIRRVYADRLARELGDPDPPRLAGPAVRDGASADAQSDSDDPLARFMRFQQAAAADAGGPLTAPPADDQADFHQIAASLGTHPHLMRRLGLVLDLLAPAGQLGLDTPGRDLRMRVAPVDLDVDEARHICPWTAVEYDSAATQTVRVFTARHRDGRAHIGLQTLGGNRTSISLEQREHAAYALRRHARETPSEPLPALLQGGMRLSRNDVGDGLMTAMAGQARLENTLKIRREGLFAGQTDCPPDEELIYADQLTRGYRVDVRNTADGRWRSLCARQGRYRAGNDWSWPKDGPLTDEGVIEPTATGGRTALRFTEDLFEWDGWSLCVARPDGAGSHAAAFSGSAADGTAPLAAEFQVPPGTLEPQRFGRSYQFRARTVDLAGNSLTTAEADQITAVLPSERVATRPEPYLRVESAKPPVIFRADPRGPAEVGDTIVLREADARENRTPRVRVHVLPPEVPIRIAEKHGLFDGMTADAGWRLIERHRGRLAFERPEAAPDDLAEDAGAVREPFPAKEIYAPYLPDPMVHQAVLVLPDGAGSVDLPAFDDLPRGMRGRRLARSCSLVVQAGVSGGVTATVRGRRTTLMVPRGRVQSIRIAAKLSARDLAVAAFDRNDDTNNGANDGRAAEDFNRRLALAAARGDVPVLAPSTVIRIVHAVQRPLVAPEFGRPLILPRAPDATTAVLADDDPSFDRPSTGRIDISARWSEPVDDPDSPAWQTIDNEIYAGGERLDDDDGNPLAPDAVAAPARSPFAHDFGDTKHREVVYQAVGTSRFTAFYPAALAEDPDSVTRLSRPVVLHVPSTAPPAPPDLAYVVPTFEHRHASGGRSAMSVEQRSQQIGAGLRVYLNRGWFSSGAGEQLALIVGTPDTPDAMADEVSSWGMNPIHDAAPLPGPLALEHVWGGIERVDAWPLDGGTVGLVLYDVFFSAEHGLPFADINFLSRRAFMPFVRLALARYQPHAIAGCHLSRIVQADFVPLAPGRSVTVKKAGRSTWQIVMHGYSFGRSGNSTSVVQAHIEAMPGDLPAAAAAWRPIGETVTLTPSSPEAWRYHWHGQVQLEDENVLSNRWQRRLVVQEFEPFKTDTDGAPDIPLEDRSRLISAHTLPI